MDYDLLKIYEKALKNDKEMNISKFVYIMTNYFINQSYLTRLNNIQEDIEYYNLANSMYYDMDQQMFNFFVRRFDNLEEY